MNIQTLLVYLTNYRFNKFRVNPLSTGINARFIVSKEFLDTIYTLLWIRNRYKEAEKLKSAFAPIQVKPIEWEAFVCET